MFEPLKKYFSDKVSLAKYEIIRVVVDIFSTIFSKFIIFSISFLTLVFSSVWMAFYIAEDFEKAKGFKVVSIAYFIITMIMILFKKTFFGSFLKNGLIKIILKKKDNKND